MFSVRLHECGFIAMLLVTLCCLEINAATTPLSSYDKIRKQIIDAETMMATGGDIWLTAREVRANSILMEAKRREIEEGFIKPDMYAPSMHFFKAKPLMKQSEVYRIIRKMPKGAMLHAHNTAMVSSKWVIRNLTRQFDVLTCNTEDGVLILTFRNTSKCATPLESLAEVRRKSKDVVKLDRQLEKQINMYSAHPELSHSNFSAVWKRFENIFETVNDLYKYVPVFRMYHTRMLEELYEDNVFYAEIRCPLSELYGTDKEYTPLDIADELQRVVDDFKASHPNFIGVKVIYAKRNTATKEKMAFYVKTFKELYANKPNFVVGFDLIGQEDYGEPLHKFVNELSEIPNGAKLFFHAGETNWYGKTDWNLLDALLLETTRIGHGYALSKHPQIWETVKARNIAIEVNPISNQVLGLVWDLRNHPATFYFSENIPVVISADDPGAWNSKGLSYDFYYAFMSFASAKADLRTLKQLALNSIKYATLNSEERRHANQVFKKMWDEFIFNVIELRY